MEAGKDIQPVNDSSKTSFVPAGASESDYVMA
jgi:hypothetical protein